MSLGRASIAAGRKRREKDQKEVAREQELEKKAADLTKTKRSVSKLWHIVIMSTSDVL